MFNNKKLGKLEAKIEALEANVKELDKKYAKIWIETVVVRFLWIAGIAVVGVYTADIAGVLEKLL